MRLNGGQTGFVQLYQIARASSSTVGTNTGQPCVIPRLKLKNGELKPPFITQLVMSEQRTFIHLSNFCLNWKVSSTLSKYFHSMVSKAFLKSMEIAMLGVTCCVKSTRR